jgi:hypothetical protein
MADSVASYAIAIGVFAFLAAVLFSARAKRYSVGYSRVEGSGTTGHSEAA